MKLGMKLGGEKLLDPIRVKLRHRGESGGDSSQRAGLKLKFVQNFANDNFGIGGGKNQNQEALL